MTDVDLLPPRCLSGRRSFTFGRPLKPRFISTSRANVDSMSSLMKRAVGISGRRGDR